MAQGGNGLYEPSPEPMTQTQAQAYLALLDVRVSRAELERGAFVANTRTGGAPASDPGPSSRARGDSPGGWLLALGFVALALLAATMPALRRREPIGTAP